MYKLFIYLFIYLFIQALPKGLEHSHSQSELHYKDCDFNTNKVKSLLLINMCTKTSLG